MIVVRNVFQLKFGKAREALAVWKDGRALFQRLGMPMEKSRLMTDVVGPFYTLVHEITVDSLTDYERRSEGHGQRGMACLVRAPDSAVRGRAPGDLLGRRIDGGVLPRDPSAGFAGGGARVRADTTSRSPCCKTRRARCTECSKGIACSAS
ncbi:MAG TPA: hypothetical protein VEO02_02715 [Thermoanaerobaculia bacterium]|nr:hypothetical protein [Thermoanaerobaculia bacterium]